MRTIYLVFLEEEEQEKDVPPEFRNLIRDSEVTKGEPVTLDCLVTGRPQPNVHWQKVHLYG